MTKIPFQAESQRLLELMINSIYTHKEIFLRELISNASDAIDKMYYRALTDDNITFNREDYYIHIQPNKEERTLTITDTGIGMSREELENNLGTIAKSGSLAFKKEQEIQDGHDIIGQFGVGFYAAFMIASEVTVTSRSVDETQAYAWTSDGTEGFSINPVDKETIGTTIVLTLKENSEDESYDEYLEEHRLQTIVKKYSDFIGYPITMNVTNQQPKDEESDEMVEVVETETINSMIPIWRKNKSELTKEDYEQFYQDKRYGFDKPLDHVHISVDGAVRYDSILYIPENVPFDYYSKEFEKGLELYANGVLIMEKCSDLLPDYFSFVKGLVDSEDLSLNISREMLQHDRQLQLIAKNIKSKIKSQLKTMQKNDRERYVTFYESFGRQLKFGVYSDFGMNKKDLEDLLLFYSSHEEKYTSLLEYIDRMPEEQTAIYYATGESVQRIKKLPQTEMVADKGFEILYLTEDIDEFAIKMLENYKEKPFQSVSSADLDFDEDQEETNEDYKELFDKMKEILGNKVSDVRESKRLKSHPVVLAADGEITIEMEKVLQSMPDNNQQVKADKVLEINAKHEVFTKLQHADEETLALYTNVLYNQALLIEGLPLEDPVAFSQDVCKVMI
ncbi:molecular chaperone HtpG [Geomicrobium sp. JCM 19055]|uniref:molecular chaperone HtpG n=1 Tax=Geomicrobium sp. JCM 19055 TaxID=1460649 RepID=UPI00045EDBBC|nr:molecular chaperone HtpG [Geomicrobium sp. JCM 19055]GAJ99774.1 chaperone protein HtpG [Geomicrobium sp. JCM 19055]